MTAATPTIMFNIGWMRHYQGLTTSDRIFNGGKYVDENHTGGEIENFLPRKGRCLGYVERQYGKVNMQRLGASKQAEYLDGVTVIFTATPESGGRVIVGWYRNARVWREYQEYKSVSFNAEAPAEHCRLLDEDNRVFEIPKARSGKFGFGQDPVRYLDEPVARSFVKRVLRYIETTEHPRARAKKHSSYADPNQRKKVETAAVSCVVDYYESEGFNCVSVEDENLGWDLECSLKKGHKLLVEVKGCAGSDATVELTPNEYEALRHNMDVYRIAIVTSALDRRPELAIVRRNRSDGTWRDEHDNQASFKERTAARISLAKGK